MKTLFWVILIVVLVILVGTWPLSILGKIFGWLGTAFEWIAKGLNFFGWNGIVK